MVDDEDDRWDDVEARVCSACHVMITISASQSGRCKKKKKTIKTRGQKMQVSVKLTGYMTEGCESRIDESPVDLFSVSSGSVLFSLISMIGTRTPTDLMPKYKKVTSNSKGALQTDSVFL